LCPIYISFIDQDHIWHAIFHAKFYRRRLTEQQPREEKRAGVRQSSIESWTSQPHHIGCEGDAENAGVENAGGDCSEYGQATRSSAIAERRARRSVSVELVFYCYTTNANRSRVSHSFYCATCIVFPTFVHESLH